MKVQPLFSILTLTLTLLGCTSCQHTTQSTNPQVVFAATLLDGATALDAFSVGLRAADDGVEKLQDTEPGYYQSIRPYLINLARLELSASAALRAAKAGDTSADWRGALVAISQAAGRTDPTTFGFKNPQTQAEVKILFASFNAAVAAIAQSFGSSASAGTGAAGSAKPSATLGGK